MNVRAYAGLGLSCVLTLALCSPLPAADKLEGVSRHGQSERGTLRGLKVVILRGTHAERGEAQGALCAREIIAEIRDFAIPTAETGSKALTGQKGIDAYEKVIRPSMSKLHWAPRFEEELAGMLRGIQKALPTAKDRLLPELGREIDLDDLKAWNTLADWAHQGCSSFAAWGALTPDGQVIAGRNLDFPSSPGVRAAHCLMAFVPSEEGIQPTLGVSFMGMIGVITAMNQDGVFVSMNNISELVSSDKTNRTPRCLALRVALEQAHGATALADVPESLRRQPILVGNNILVCRSAPRGPLAAVLEWDGQAQDSGVTLRSGEQRNGASAIFCTNHYVDRGGTSPEAGSLGRYAAMREEAGRFLADEKQLSSLQEARRVLARSAGPKTLHSVVVWPATRSWAVALSSGEGKPAVTEPWTEFSWTDVLPAP